MARSIIIQKVLSYLQPQQQDGFRRGFFLGERKRADLVWGTSVAADSFSKETEKHKNGGKQLISAKDFAELKMKSGKYIELHLIPWPHPSPIFFFSLFNSIFFFFLTYAATGVSQLPRVPFLSAPKSKPVCPHLFSSGQKRKKHKFQPRPCWPTSRQYPFQLNPSFSLPPPPRRRWSLSAEAVKLWGGNTHGEVSAPLCVNAWEVTYLGTERKEKEGGVEYQFRCSLLGQIHLLYGMKKKRKKPWMSHVRFFSIFSNSTLLFFLPRCILGEYMDVVRFIAKSIPVHGSYSLTPNRGMRVQWRNLSPAAPLRLALHQNCSARAFFFSFFWWKWELKDWVFSALALRLVK